MRANASRFVRAVSGSPVIVHAKAAALAAVSVLVTFAVLDLLATPSAFAAPSAQKPRVRTLDEITIEGEIPLPQVLFVTATESARIESAYALLYTPSALDIGRAAALPGFLCVPASLATPVITEVPAP